MATTAGDSFFLSFFASFLLLKRTPKTATKNSFSRQHVPMVRVFLSFFLSLLLSLFLSFEKTKNKKLLFSAANAKGERASLFLLYLSFLPSFEKQNKKTRKQEQKQNPQQLSQVRVFLSFFPSLKTKQNFKNVHFLCSNCHRSGCFFLSFEKNNNNKDSFSFFNPFAATMSLENNQ